MVNQQEEAIRRLLEKYRDYAILGAQFSRDNAGESPESVFRRNRMQWIQNVRLGIDPSGRQGGEYGLDEARMVGSFLREAREAGIESKFVETLNNMHIMQIRKNYVPLETVLASITRGNNVDPSTLEGMVRGNRTLSGFLKTVPEVYGEIVVVPKELVGRFTNSVNNQPRSMVVPTRETEKDGREERRSGYPQQHRPGYQQPRRTTARPAQSQKPVVTYLTHNTLGAFADFARFLPPSSSTSYTTVVGLLQDIVTGIERLPNREARLQEKSRLAVIANNARRSVIKFEGSEKQIGIPEYLERLSREVDAELRSSYVPLESVVAEAMEGLELEGGIMFQMRGQVKDELKGSGNVVTVQHLPTGKEGSYVNWQSENSMVKEARRIVGKKAAKPLYVQGGYVAVQQRLHGMGVKNDAELEFISVSSSYRQALTVPASNRGRGLSLGALKNAIANYVMFLQRHPQGAPGMETELNEDFRKGEEFAAQLRQQNQPKDYVKGVEAVFRDSEFRKYAPHEQNSDGLMEKVFGFLGRR